MPALLAYPTPLDLSAAPEIKGVLCYVLRHYGHDGLSVLISRRRNQQSKDVDVGTVFGDWHGRPLDRQAAFIPDFLRNVWQTLVQTMQLIRLEQAQFFFAIEGGLSALTDVGALMLVDIQIALNKFAGPGMVRDLFGNVLRVQETVKIEVLDERALGAIRDGTGSYSGDLMIKPSKFRTVERSRTIQHNGRAAQPAAGRLLAEGTRPFYIEVLR